MYSYDINSNILFQSFKGTALAMLVLWTVAANSLVFVVLYKNPRLQTVPNLLVANLAFSDLCLGLIVLPLSSIYVVAGEWLFTSTLCVVFVSADILCSTASIWNLSIVGLDRYWAITAPTTYMTKRNKKTAILMILSVWASSALISLAPLLGWKQIAERGNMIQINNTWQCVFLDLPSYTVYSATGSFFIPLIVMFFVYYKIYQAFAKHKARQIYRQKVIRKHIESTILHEINNVLPLTEHDYDKHLIDDCVYEENEEVDEDYCEKETDRGNPSESVEIDALNDSQARKTWRNPTIRNNYARNIPSIKSKKEENLFKLTKKRLSMEHIQQCKKKIEKKWRRSIERKPNTISAAKERRGVKVLGIILGCFTICWTPFFIMYVLVQFCSNCSPNQHIEMFITWLGYSNSAMNPIIYTVNFVFH
ncbi:unnamed protein product [Dracunculus medinensis]|uniref:G_PROTEIN_RECEP_F1_2 domain-containing protein n=1 Tax=Dracunculus medinensis TaxID=318479 RepID=A0A158Q4M8_DRAME|nr:unnamed protein product [Dracunculus medinensis]